MLNRKTITVILAAATVALASSSAMSATAWQRHHPGRTEVNGRLANQNRRITQERREGEITHGQAQALRANDHAIRREERADARADHNHGHLTGAQIHTLNSQENANSGAIGH